MTRKVFQYQPWLRTPNNRVWISWDCQYYHPAKEASTSDVLNTRNQLFFVRIMWLMFHILYRKNIINTTTVRKVSLGFSNTHINNHKERIIISNILFIVKLFQINSFPYWNLLDRYQVKIEEELGKLSDTWCLCCEFTNTHNHATIKKFVPLVFTIFPQLIICADIWLQVWCSICVGQYYVAI